MFHFAYLDPTTGSLFIQAVIGSIAGAGFIFRNAISKVVRKVTSFKNRDAASAKE